MKLRIEMTCDNAAFEPSQGAEVARILDHLATWVQPFDKISKTEGLKLFDINGNHCGTFAVID